MTQIKAIPKGLRKLWFITRGNILCYLSGDHCKQINNYTEPGIHKQSPKQTLVCSCRRVHDMIAAVRAVKGSFGQFKRKNVKT